MQCMLAEGVSDIDLNLLNTSICKHLLAFVY
jgi:hypothetical protein